MPELKDLNKGVMNAIMNAGPDVNVENLVLPSQGNTPVALDPVTPSAPPVVMPVPAIDDFPSVPDSLIPGSSQKPADVQPPASTTKTEPLPPPGTAQPSNDKDVNFAKLRTKLESTTAELVELKAKYFDPDGKQLKSEFTQSKDETDKLKQELQATQDRLARYNLMEDPRFVKKYQSKIGKIESEAKRVMKDFGIEEGLLKEVQNLSPKQRHDIILQKAPDAQYMLEPLLVQADQIRNEQQAELDDWKNTVKTLDLERTGDTELKVRQMKEALHSSATRQLEEEGHLLLQTVPGNEKWNAGVEALKRDMKQTLEVNDPKLQTKLLHQGILAPVYMTLFLKERSRAEDLQRQLVILGGTRPDIGSRTGETSASSGTRPTVEATPENAARANARKIFG